MKINAFASDILLVLLGMILGIILGWIIRSEKIIQVPDIKTLNSDTSHIYFKKQGERKTKEEIRRIMKKHIASRRAYLDSIYESIEVEE